MRVDLQPTPHGIARKSHISQARRSLNVTVSPDEIGQHCRAGYLSDRLGEIVTDAAVARYLLDVGADDEAIVLLERIVGNFRETAKTAKVLKDTAAATTRAAAGPSPELIAEAAREYRQQRGAR
jgi:hypothetical protein